MFKIGGAIVRHLRGFRNDAAADAVAEGGASRKQGADAVVRAEWCGG
jgi:hypothetical protein